MQLGALVFILTPLLGMVYVMWHVWCILPSPIGVKVLVMLAMIGAFLLLYVAIGPSLDTLPMSWATVIYEVSTSWLIILLYLFLIFVVLDLGRLFHLVPKQWLFGSWKGLLGIITVITVLLVCGNIHYRHKVRQTLTMHSEKKLQRHYRLVMMSDLHLGYHNQRDEFHRWVDMINQENPDMILIAGDIIDRSLRPLQEQKMWEEFRRLKAPVVACLGNHEYYAGKNGSEAFYAKAGIRLLRDSSMEWGGIAVVGRDDRTNPRRKTVRQLLQDVDTSKYLILMDHQPFHLSLSEQAGVDFQLSGHTHYGQIWPISWITDAVYECAYGPYQIGKTHYYVSSGLGIWGGKYRIGTRSEYIVMELSE